MADISQQLQSQLEQAYRDGTALSITAGNSKAFYGRSVHAEPLLVNQNTGIINYEPTELVITARAGTPLSEIISTLRSQNQMLGFEPPALGATATLGGTIACNLSGPRRPYRGAARDYVLGSTIINGKAEQMHFGGEVMKNVAGYDVSRLMCGAMGTLGVILDVSLKVIPLPESETTLVFELPIEKALQKIHQWTRESYPVSASCHLDNKLYLRLASNPLEISAAKAKLGGEILESDTEFWQQLNEQQLDFFNTQQPVWRLSLASDTPPLPLQGETLYDWGGALRWFKGDETADRIRHTLDTLDGHATLFRNNPTQLDPFHELSSGVMKVHRQLKMAFDPGFILNPGRMYADI